MMYLHFPESQAGTSRAVPPNQICRLTSISVALKSSLSTFCSAAMAVCTVSSKENCGSFLNRFSRKLSASWSFAPALVPCSEHARLFSGPAWLHRDPEIQSSACLTCHHGLLNIFTCLGRERYPIMTRADSVPPCSRHSSRQGPP